MSINKCVTMVLAGGRGERLGALTRYYSKPAIHFGGKSRIIDFTLRNCRDSGLETIGILSQYDADNLCGYIEAAYGSYSISNNIYMLPPQNSADYYRGTADAVYKNIRFMEPFRPECVLVLSGDHIYKMDYGKIINFHMDSGADVTVASTLVPVQEASRFGIINADENGRIFGFEEKPKRPKSRLASMGIYVFKWDVLIKYLLADNADAKSQHDFGRNILPGMLRSGESMYTYQFNGYWRDVGTVDSLWEANMDQIDGASGLGMYDGRQDVLSSYASEMPCRMSADASVNRSIVSGECTIFGKVAHSVLGDSVIVGKGAEIVNSVIMPNVYIGDNAKIYNAIIGTRAVIMNDTVIGTNDGTGFFIDNTVCSRGISLISPWLYLREGMRIRQNSHINRKRMDEWGTGYTNVALKPVSHSLLENRYPSRRRQMASLIRN